MPVGVELKFKGATLRQYDEMIQKMQFQPKGKGAQGGLFHWVTQTNDGIKVVDVWESKELFEKFANEKMVPFTREVGIKSSPEISYFDVHNYLTSSSNN